MTENKMIQKQILKNILYNLLAFTLIFATFGAIIFNQVSNYLYSNVNEQLLETKERMQNGTFVNLEVAPTPVNVIGGGLLIKQNREALYKADVGPRIINIIRDKDGNILNSSSIGNFYDKYLVNLRFDKNNTNKLFDIRIGRDSFYRGIAFKITDTSNETLYVQLLINVDGEVSVQENLLRILFIGIAITVTLAICASVILRRENITTYNRFMEKTTGICTKCISRTQNTTYNNSSKTRIIIKGTK